MSSLKTFLDDLYLKYRDPAFLQSDPLEFAHQYRSDHEREAVALLSALLAYGNVKQIRRSVADALSRMSQVSDDPAEFVKGLSKPKHLAEAKKGFRGFVHRFNVGGDLIVLLQLLNRSWQVHGSLGAHFLSHLDPADANIARALSSFIAEWRAWARPLRPAPTFAYLLNSPADGSCCKRWCMFLRWMGRRDSLDLGLWDERSELRKGFPEGRWLRPDQLVIPLDTHTGRISQYLALTSRKSLNWRAAVEVTDALRRCNPLDPTRYDFALSRLGILDLCQKRFRMHICEGCGLYQVCHYAQARVQEPRGP